MSLPASACVSETTSSPTPLTSPRSPPRERWSTYRRKSPGSGNVWTVPRQRLQLSRQAVKQALAFSSITVHTLPGLGSIAAMLGMRPDTRILTLGPMGCYAALPSVDIIRSLVDT